MRIVVVGATGHVGGCLIPRLVTAGHEVIAISRGQQPPYRDHPAWSGVRRVVADRQAEDEAGTFAGRIADLRADVVIDMICFTRESAEQLVTALAGRIELLVHTAAPSGYTARPSRCQRRRMLYVDLSASTASARPTSRTC